MTKHDPSLAGRWYCPVCGGWITHVRHGRHEVRSYCAQCTYGHLRGALTLAESAGALGVWRPFKGALTAQGES